MKTNIIKKYFHKTFVALSSELPVLPFSGGAFEYFFSDQSDQCFQLITCENRTMRHI